MPNYFFDTSALAKAYHREAGTERVLAWMAEPGSRLLISSLAVVELQSALAQKLRAGVVTTPHYELARRKFGGDIRTRRLVVKGLFRRHLHAAAKLIDAIAPTKRLRTLDSIQLAVAIELITNGAAGHFVVADEPLAQFAILRGLSVINPIVP